MLVVHVSTLNKTYLFTCRTKTVSKIKTQLNLVYAFTVSLNLKENPFHGKYCSIPTSPDYCRSTSLLIKTRSNFNESATFSLLHHKNYLLLLTSSLFTYFPALRVVIIDQYRWRYNIPKT